MKCKECKCHQTNLICLLDRSIMRTGNLECYFEEMIQMFQEKAQRRDEVNASDRGNVKYICHDDPEGGPLPCLYGSRTEPEADCAHLEDGGHPEDCDKAELDESDDEGDNS